MTYLPSPRLATESETTATHDWLPGDYIYEASLEERAAADLLVAKGWSVREPGCPLCYAGRLMERRDGMWRLTDNRCPNGCWTPEEQMADTDRRYPR